MARHQTTTGEPTNSKENVMVDIETLGTEPGSVIIAIGLCEFDREGIGRKKQISVSADSCESLGMKRDPDTVEWWQNQPEAARQQLDGGADLPDALDTLSDFCDCDQRIWANSPCFDVVLLEDAYRRCSRNPPWEYWNTRDMQTVRDILHWPDGADQMPRDLGIGVPPDAPATEHHALYDAIVQAVKTQLALNLYRVSDRHE